MSQIDRRLARALRAHHARDLGTAATLCREILSQRPNHADACHLLGVIHSQQGSQSEALQLVAVALRARPDNPHYHNTQGNALHKAGRQDEAIASFQRALKLDPRYADAWNNLGLAYQASGRLSDAMAAFRRALAIAPHSALAHNSLGNALVAQGDFSAAISCFQTAIRLDPAYHEAYSNLGNTYKLDGNLDAAMQSYDAAVALAKDDLGALNNRAMLQLQQGRHREATGPLEEALSRHPGDCATRTHLAVAYAAAGRLTEARTYLDQALATNDRFAPAHFYHGHVLRALGESDGAIAGYLRAISLEPNYAEAFDGLIFTLLDTLRFDDLHAITDSVFEEERLTAEQRAGLRTIRAIAHWVCVDFEACAREIKNAMPPSPQFFPNRPMIEIYRQYLALLLDFKARHSPLYDASRDDDLSELCVIGESHALAPAWTMVTLEGRAHRVVPQLVMGAKAWHFAQPSWNEHKENLQRIVATVPEHAPVLFVFGEIDCRQDDGILRYLDHHPAEDLEQVALKTAVGYIEHLAAATSRKRFVTAVQGVPAPNIGDIAATSERALRLAYLIRFWNAALATLAAERGWRFVDVHALTASPGGWSNRRWHLDNYHLQPSYLSQLFAT